MIIRKRARVQRKVKISPAPAKIRAINLSSLKALRIRPKLRIKINREKRGRRISPIGLTSWLSPQG